MKAIMITITILLATLTCANAKDFNGVNDDELAGIQQLMEEGLPHTKLLLKLKKDYPKYTKQSIIIISGSQQKLTLYNKGELLGTYPISTGITGMGNKSGSGKTPLGAHRVSHRYGDNAKLGTIFKARRNTGKIAKIITQPISIKTDDVTTRVMWLDGLEKGKNKGGKVDSHRRYIYIHGTPEEGLIGKPASHGCIRMLNEDVINLFDSTAINSFVYIVK
ncbi:MAG: L,D-transpeptidase [Thiotrichaceae bacterium]|nr:L,D-transpeptidase [Thiotrichaceae bacterium]